MAYFGGGGIASNVMHPSLKAYIDCFDSSPFPRMWPRGGGIWDQDPILVRDFRVIRNSEVQWKRTQEQLQRMNGTNPTTEGAQGGNLEDLLNEMLEERGLEGDSFF